MLNPAFSKTYIEFNLSQSLSFTTIIKMLIPNGPAAPAGFQESSRIQDVNRAAKMVKVFTICPSWTRLRFVVSTQWLLGSCLTTGPVEVQPPEYACKGQCRPEGLRSMLSLGPLLTPNFLLILDHFLFHLPQLDSQRSPYFSIPPHSPSFWIPITMSYMAFGSYKICISPWQKRPVYLSGEQGEKNKPIRYLAF